MKRFLERNSAQTALPLSPGKSAFTALRSQPPSAPTTPTAGVAPAPSAAPPPPPPASSPPTVIDFQTQLFQSRVSDATPGTAPAPSLPFTPLRQPQSTDGASEPSMRRPQQVEPRDREELDDLSAALSSRLAKHGILLGGTVSAPKYSQPSSEEPASPAKLALRELEELEQGNLPIFQDVEEEEDVKRLLDERKSRLSSMDVSFATEPASSEEGTGAQLLNQLHQWLEQRLQGLNSVMEEASRATSRLESQRQLKSANQDASAATGQTGIGTRKEADEELSSDLLQALQPIHLPVRLRSLRLLGQFNG